MLFINIKANIKYMKNYDKDEKSSYLSIGM